MGSHGCCSGARSLAPGRRKDLPGANVGPSHHVRRPRQRSYAEFTSGYRLNARRDRFFRFRGDDYLEPKGHVWSGFIFEDCDASLRDGEARTKGSVVAGASTEITRKVKTELSSAGRSRRAGHVLDRDIYKTRISLVPQIIAGEPMHLREGA